MTEQDRSEQREVYQAPTLEKGPRLAEITEAEDVIVPLGGGGT